MQQVSNAPPVLTGSPVVVKKTITEKVSVHQPELRPLPEVDRNELHCVMQPVYPGDRVIFQEPGNLQYDQGQVLAPQGNSGMVQNEGYVERQVKIKEKIKQTDIM